MRATTGRGLVPALVIVGSALAVLLAACADFAAPPSAEEGLSDVLVGNPSFSNDIQPLFNARCATSSCHTTVTQQAGMSLEAGAAYAEIVGVQATTRPTRLRVEPGNPGNSLVYLAITPASPIVRMPLGRTPLTPNQIENIRRWIEQGAPNN